MPIQTCLKQTHMPTDPPRCCAAPAAQQQSPSLDDPIHLPFTPSGPTSPDSTDVFNVHKIRLAPLQTWRRPHTGQPSPGLAGGPAGVGLPGKAFPSDQRWTDSGPVAEGLEVEASAASDAGMSEAGSSRSGDDPQERHWGVLQAAKNAFWKRCGCNLQLLLVVPLTTVHAAASELPLISNAVSMSQCSET